MSENSKLRYFFFSLVRRVARAGAWCMRRDNLGVAPVEERRLNEYS